MPYIKKKQRNGFTGGGPALDAGELNYLLTLTVIEYVQDHGLSYKTLNDVSGALTECLAEFRRRVIAPYEDSKIAENGDVYPEDLTSKKS